MNLWNKKWKYPMKSKKKIKEIQISNTQRLEQYIQINDYECEKMKYGKWTHSQYNSNNVNINAN